MATHILRQIWTAISHLNPNDVRSLAEQNLGVGLHASSEKGYQEMEEFLCPRSLSPQRRLEVLAHLYRAQPLSPPPRLDVEIYHASLAPAAGGFIFQPEAPGKLVREVLAERANLSLTLARLFPPFREPVIDDIIWTVSKENALFSIATAVPDVVPSLIQLPWAVGQVASDTAFLTGNQTRMAFLIAAASNRRVGYREQRNEIGSILAGAFGWRALARQLVAKIPFGGGLIPKAAIAFAGTYVAGRALERYYRDGYWYTAQEQKVAYEGAFETGKRVARELLETLGIDQGRGARK
ncbi:MAG: hypothetical protein NZV14_11210 [Bryobacteraceae bacterium]|nr:hypothetical protein [Bryobacteraceae bacterium]MDW8378721.1 hypothetical protein [Bryobacterales bacterium]